MNKLKFLLSPLAFAMLVFVVGVLTLSLWFMERGLRKDETVVFFPTSATRNADGSWALLVHSWIFELEEGDLLRSVARRLIGELVEQFGISESETRSQLFKDRIKYFLVDNERRKQLKITISSLKHRAPIEAILAKSTANGHSWSDLVYKRGDVDGSWLTLSVTMPKGDHRSFLGQIKLVPPDGLSVICDIDDTIKVSNVLNKRDLMRNSLFRPYKSVRSMSRHLRELEAKGAYFHYVSASPWQLYPSLKQFLDNSVPRGSIALRNLRLKDKSFLDFLGSSEDYKLNRISAILKRYPKHRFVLIGDSGEHDPEIYGRIYRAYPNNIETITIRAVEGSNTRQQRFIDAFAGVPKAVWNVRTFAE